MSDVDLLHHINMLIDRQLEVRARRESGVLDAEEESRQLAEVGAAVHHCWDLIRQRAGQRLGDELGDVATDLASIADPHQR